MSAVIEMACTCGACPVQYEGTINGKPFYYRSRWDEWRLAIANTIEDAQDAGVWSLNNGTSLFFAKGDDDELDMDKQNQFAKQIIQQCADAFHVGKTTLESKKLYELKA
jgi:hypothetical protein